jgi:hypothetical protein
MSRPASPRRCVLGMRRAAALLAVLSCVFVTGGPATGAPAAPRPSWVADGVQTLRSYFRGKPRPSRVTWGVGAHERWVTVFFRQLEVCVLCHGGPARPAPRRVVTGRRATITWYQGGIRRMSVSIQKH